MTVACCGCLSLRVYGELCDCSMLWLFVFKGPWELCDCSMLWLFVFKGLWGAL